MLASMAALRLRQPSLQVVDVSFQARRYRSKGQLMGQSNLLRPRFEPDPGAHLQSRQLAWQSRSEAVMVGVYRASESCWMRG